MRIMLARLLVGILVFSGCVAEPASSSEESTPRSVARRTYTAPATPQALLNVAPVELDGRTTTYGCVISPVTTACQGLMGGNALQSFADGTTKALRLQGNLTWLPETPATMNLNAYLVVDGRYQYGFPVAYGPSPVTVDFDLTEYVGHNLAVGFSSTSCICPVAMGVVHAAPQDFSFRGEFTSETT